MKQTTIAMPEHVDLLIEDERWAKFDLSRLAQTAVRSALDISGFPKGDFEISILACNNDRIAQLNSSFRGKESPTNVLSWPAFDLAPDSPGSTPSKAVVLEEPEATSLGDIAISIEKVMEEAENSHIPAENHIIHLLIHAVLHLLGYDHENDADAERMERLEISALEKLGINSPY